MVVEPIWSNTWVEAEADTTGPAAVEIRKGRRTIENEFFFSNVQMRMGMSYEFERATFHMGVEVRSYDYTLEQRDNLEGTMRDQDESWMEWTPSIGAKLKFPEFEFGAHAPADHLGADAVARSNPPQPPRVSRP